MVLPYSESPMNAMPRVLVPTFALSLLVLGSVACNQAAPPGTESEETAEEESGVDKSGVTDSEENQSLYPLVNNSRWVYNAKTTQGQVLGMENVSLIAMQWNGLDAWKLTDEADENGEWTESILVRQEAEVLRVYKEEHGDLGITAYVYYDPGFLRADDDWLDAAVDSYEERLYDRTEYDNPDMLNPMHEARGHAYRILALDETVTVPAGTFECVKVERIRTIGGAAGERVIHWYAPGIGKVREERPADSRIEELAEVSIPSGAQFP